MSFNPKLIDGVRQIQKPPEPDGAERECRFHVTLRSTMKLERARIHFAKLLGVDPSQVLAWDESGPCAENTGTIPE